MKTIDNTMMYENPVVSELNRVPNFDPLKFLKVTENGPKLDLKYKKLWFRLKYPQGRIRLSNLYITDQIAIIEARVFFDCKDTESVSNYTARCDISSAPDGKYLKYAQNMAIEQALNDAGFGIQFSVDSKSTEIIAEKENVSMNVPLETCISEPEKETMHATSSAKPESTPDEDDETQMDEQEQPEETPPMYSKEMSVEDICELMSLEDAENYIVPNGVCAGQKLSLVAERRPASLQFYVNGYKGDDNILRAAASLILSARPELLAG